MVVKKLQRKKLAIKFGAYEQMYGEVLQLINKQTIIIVLVIISRFMSANECYFLISMFQVNVFGTLTEYWLPMEDCTENHSKNRIAPKSEFKGIKYALSGREREREISQISMKISINSLICTYKQQMNIQKH